MTPRRSERKTPSIPAGTITTKPTPKSSTKAGKKKANQATSSSAPTKPTTKLKVATEDSSSATRNEDAPAASNTSVTAIATAEEQVVVARINSF